MDRDSLDQDVISVIKLRVDEASSATKPANTHLDGAYKIYIPAYYISQFFPGQGALLGTEYLKVVAPPTNKGTKVEGKVFTSQGTNFFAENKVVISGEGEASIAGIISRFNSISEIVVNGGASNKSTTYSSDSGEGNAALAKDRLLAGIALLNKLKTGGTVQLKGATIKEGEAKVQDIAEESDAKNQQVTFVITGMEKGNPGEEKTVMIDKASEKRADEAYLIGLAISIGLGAGGDYDKNK